MNGREFIRRARRYARRTGQSFRIDSRRGKGSHQKLWVGDRWTMVQHGEIPPGTFYSMLRELGIDRQEF